jgi:hypothetical protein
MHNPASPADRLQRVDVALLVGDSGYRLGVLQFVLADGDPTHERFETFGPSASHGPRGIGVRSALDAHTASVRLSLPDNGTAVLLDDVSLSAAAQNRTAWIRHYALDGRKLGTAPLSANGHVGGGPPPQYELALTTTDDPAACLTLRLRSAEATWFETEVCCARDGDGWWTTHGWTAYDPGPYLCS